METTTEEPIKRAVVARAHEHYAVAFLEDGNVVGVRILEGKSKHYAEDVALNWTEGLIELTDEDKNDGEVIASD